MDFDLSQDQQDIKRTARDLLTARSTWERVRAAAEGGTYDDALWSELRELGWPGIAIGEAHGGQGLGSVELAVLLEELGYACAVTPFLGTVLAGLAIDAAGSDEQKARWLPGLASGEQTGGFGAADLVVDGPGAAVLVIAAADGALAIVEGGAEPLAAIDPTRRFGTTSAFGEPLGGDTEAALDRVRAALAAEVVGVCQRALDMTLDYVKERKQFEVPVGSFQAVSHRCAQMLLHTESVRSAAYFAAWAADAAPDRLPEGAALAGAAAAEGGRETTASAIQAHGGIGFTWEADVHWLYKRAQLDSALLGGGRRHRARLARIAASALAASTPARMGS